MRDRVKRARRLVVWDGKGIDWGLRQACEVATLRELHARALEPGPMRLSIRVPVTRENFGLFCRLAWIWGRYKPGVIVVDEVADVTNPGKAPTEWGEILRKCRSFGTDVYVTTQRPQECDKTAQGNALLFHCGQQADADDQRYVARRLLGGVPVDQVAQLQPLEYLERDVRTRQVKRGKVRPA